MRIIRKTLLMLACVLAITMAAAGTTQAAYNYGINAAKANVLTGGKLKKVNGKWYYLKNKKVAVKNDWAMINGKAYSFDRKGAAKTGQFKENGKTFWANSKGVVTYNRWKSMNGEKYYFNGEGFMLKGGYKQIGNKYYYFRKNGTLARDCWIGGRYANSNGVIYLDMLTKAETKKAAKNNKLLIIVGASRVSHMAEAVSGGTRIVYISQPGAGLSWFMNGGMARLQIYLKQYPKSTVVFQMGNNDITGTADGKYKEYIRLYKRLFKQYKKAKFYIMDALPTYGPRGDKTNPLRQQFNARMKAAFGSKCIGGYDYLVQVGYAPRSETDVMHYDDETYVKLYNYILSKVRF